MVAEPAAEWQVEIRKRGIGDIRLVKLRLVMPTGEHDLRYVRIDLRGPVPADKTLRTPRGVTCKAGEQDFQLSTNPNRRLAMAGCALMASKSFDREVRRAMTKMKRSTARAASNISMLAVQGGRSTMT